MAGGQGVFYSLGAGMNDGGKGEIRRSGGGGVF